MFFRTFLLSVLVLSCSRIPLNNPCDPNTNAYAKTTLVAELVGDHKNVCYPGVIIKNNPGLNLSQSFGQISEYGGSSVQGSSLNFTVSFGSEPKEEVNVQVIVSNPAFATVTPTSFQWKPSDWNSERTVTVTAVNDSLLNGTRDFLIRVVPTSLDTSLKLQEQFISMKILDNEKHLFLNANTTKGNLGGISGADATCSSDPNCPLGSQCKAMLVTDSGIRRATVTGNLGDGQVDWVLKPFTSYYRSDNITLIGSTNAVSLLIFPLQAGIDSASVTTWTGMGSSWDSQPDHCSNWGNSISGNGVVGDSISTSASVLSNLNVGCTSDLKFYCAEQ
ncbi:DUF1554 domain-containing protein [Leptospira brenneri]|uniref:DUF1554 domain-containing protein n=1 Tax=Leptospira brenneri TaxID=2023182 RepID=A0A2M9Y4S7_9LEPT|nr:DUF1554 domain-containing protein [Leptospira brenneri]PJZ46557.1 hypothetical protein CH361_05625 [Leptospira brenneri]TGK96665.1 DUF1554 domain-containing protein [Leptospira brenneri]